MTCPKCNDTGKIPFVNDAGKVIANVLEYCSCHQDEPERYYPIRPEDYDFPASADFRAYTYRYCGQPDPGAVTVNVEREVEIRYRPRPIDKEIDQLKGGFIHIQKVINEHVDASKKKAKKVAPKTYTFNEDVDKQTVKE